MKEKYFSKNHLILIIILFTCIFIFSTTSLALIPGDFGSAGGGPPDGCVDFEDLMIFAMAYGSTPTDANWNPLCDIYPDGVIDFEDLMIFAMHYGERDVVSDIEVSTIIYQSSMSKLIDTKIKLEEGKLQPTYYFNEIKEIQKGVTGYAIYVGWHGYPNATGYRIYRSVNGGDYSIIIDEEISGYTWYGRYDHDVSPGNTYSYYVTAYGSDWETEPSEIITRDTWLPPCSLISPTDQAITTDSNPTFTWNPVGLTNFPYESTIYSGESDLWIYDDTAEEKVWHPYFYDMTTSTIVYDTDGQATPLVAGHSYLWQSSGYGFDNNGHLIAMSFSDNWDFIYSGGAPAGITEVYAKAKTYNSSRMLKTMLNELEKDKASSAYYFNELEESKDTGINYSISLDWSAYCETTGCGYRVYRKINEGDYEIVFSQDAPTGYDWYNWYDNEAGPGSTYSYYITAYGTDWETAPSEIVTIDIWLPPCSLVSPADQAIITESNPTFTWNPTGLTVSDLPYGSIISGDSRLWVYDDTAEEEVWYVRFEDDLITSTITYNDDEQAAPLTAGHSYYWEYSAYGYDENGNQIAASSSGGRDFVYSGGMPAGITKVYARAETYNSSRMLKIMLNELEEDKASSVYYFNEPKESKEAEINHLITLYWSAYCETTGCGYRVYRKINEGDYEIVFSQDAPTGYDWYNWYDNEAGPGSTYSYYVTAYGTDWETDASEIVTIDTWLPPCSLISPTNESIITDSNPTFIWNPVGLSVSDFPYGSITSGDTRFWVYDDTVEEEAWYVQFENDLTTFTITYNDDGQATPLTASHSYYWNSRAYGYDENGNCIAASGNGDWKFIYSGGALAGITDVEAIARTRHLSTMSKCYLNELEKSRPGQGYFFNENNLLEKGEMNYSITLSWAAYCETTGCGYRVYRKINEEEYEIVFSRDAPTGYDWYEWEDNEAGPGNTYFYYVTAYGSDWETDPSEIVTRDTWLPSSCTLISPEDGSIITDPNPIFTWSSEIPDFPYGSIDSGGICMGVYDQTTHEYVWIICFDETTTSTATYNQDGQATPLSSGHNYIWYSWSYGRDENGDWIATSESEHWEFWYLVNL